MSNPDFIPPDIERVYCWMCGRSFPAENARGINTAPNDEYYPIMEPVCPRHQLPEEDG